jgi:hypothetical protein
MGWIRRGGPDIQMASVVPPYTNMKYKAINGRHAPPRRTALHFLCFFLFSMPAPNFIRGKRKKNNKQYASANYLKIKNTHHETPCGKTIEHEIRILWLQPRFCLLEWRCHVLPGHHPCHAGAGSSDYIL